VSLYIGVAGASQPDASLLPIGEALGRCLAEARAIVVCGGGTGVMTAVCRGAQAAGGQTVGLLPGADRDGGNPYLSVALPTALGEGRNLLLVRASDALVAVGGGFGTLSEIALALRIGLPVVGLATWGLTLSGEPVDAFPVVGSPEEAARLAIDAATRPRKRP
jgi:uncharacterized protein (TIGR00725 family)